MSILPDSNSYLDREFINFNVVSNKLLENPLLLKDVWYTVDDLGLKLLQHDKALTINFGSIQQDWLKRSAKLYILVRSNRQVSTSYVTHAITSFNRFSKFIKHKSIFSPSQINDLLFDEFEYDLKSSNISQVTIGHYLKHLKSFFDLCREEKWLTVNTYWFKGKSGRHTPNNDDIEYIPQEVWNKLEDCLDDLPKPLALMIVIIRSIGLRVGELLNLPFDCLRQRGEKWHLRFLTEKYQTEDELPISEDLLLIIKEQQQYIKHHFGDNYNYLFSSHVGGRSRHYTPKPNVMEKDVFNDLLNKLAKKHNICTKEGNLWHFKSHQFRRTYATIMANAGVRDLTIQKSLRQHSSSMLMHYINLNKDVLGEEFQNLMKGTDYVNGLGELVKRHQPKNLLTEVIRRKVHQITTQVGSCHRPALKSPCETINACWHCKHWLTSIDDLPILKEDLQGIEAELEIANSLGMIRNQQGLSVEKQLLSIRIEALEKIND